LSIVNAKDVYATIKRSKAKRISVIKSGFIINTGIY